MKQNYIKDEDVKALALMEKKPRWIIWYAPVLLLLLFGIVLGFCFIIKYPEIIRISAKITSGKIIYQEHIDSLRTPEKVYDSINTDTDSNLIIVGYLDIERGKKIKKGLEASFTYRSKLVHCVIDTTIATERDIMVISILDVKDLGEIQGEIFPQNILLNLMTDKKSLYSRVIEKLKAIK